MCLHSRGTAHSFQVVGVTSLNPSDATRVAMGLPIETVKDLPGETELEIFEAMAEEIE